MSVNLPITSGVFDKDIIMMKVVTFCTRLCKHYLQVICHTNLGYLASMFMYNGYVHLQWNEIEQGPSLVSPQYNSVPIEPFKGGLGVLPHNI